MLAASRRIFAVHSLTSGSSPTPSGCSRCDDQNRSRGGTGARSSLWHDNSRFPRLARLDESFLVPLIDKENFVWFRRLSFAFSVVRGRKRLIPHEVCLLASGQNGNFPVHLLSVKRHCSLPTGYPCSEHI